MNNLVTAEFAGGRKVQFHFQNPFYECNNNGKPISFYSTKPIISYFPCLKELITITKTGERFLKIAHYYRKKILQGESFAEFTIKIGHQLVDKRFYVYRRDFLNAYNIDPINLPRATPIPKQNKEKAPLCDNKLKNNIAKWKGGGKNAYPIYSTIETARINQCKKFSLDLKVLKIWKKTLASWKLKKGVFERKKSFTLDSLSALSSYNIHFYRAESYGHFFRKATKVEL